MTDVLFAVGASVLLGLIGTKAADYRYWRFWASKPYWTALAAMIALYIVAGAAGLAVLRSVGADSGIGLAIVAGVAGHAVFRAQLDLSEGDGRSLMVRVREWLINWLDGRAEEALRKAINRLSDDDLVEQAFNIFWGFIYDPVTRAREDPEVAIATDKLLTLYQDAAAALPGGGVDAQNGRSTLYGLCCREMATRRLIL